MNLKKFYDILAVFLSINIITWFTFAIYYGIKTILLHRKRKRDIYFTTYFPIIVSALYVSVFWYIMICAAIGSHVVDNSTFGALYIRPIILLTAVGTAISQLEKYRRTRSER